MRQLLDNFRNKLSDDYGPDEPPVERPLRERLIPGSWEDGTWDTTLWASEYEPCAGGLHLELHAGVSPDSLLLGAQRERVTYYPPMSSDVWRMGLLEGHGFLTLGLGPFYLGLSYTRWKRSK